MRVNEVIIHQDRRRRRQHRQQRDQLNDALVEAAAGGPWPKLMLMSWAASGVAETIRAATEAAAAVTRTRRPRAAASDLARRTAQQTRHLLLEAVVERLALLRPGFGLGGRRPFFGRTRGARRP